MGIVVTSIVLCALSVFTLGVSDQWMESGSGQSMFLSGTMAVDRLNHLVRGALMMDPNATATQCMLWLTDTNADGKIQFGEQALLSYDSVDQELLEYTAPASDTVTNSPSSTLSTPNTFLAAANLSTKVLAHNVTACRFMPLVGGGSVRSSLEVTLTFTSGTIAPVTSATIYTTVTLRTPGQAQ